MVSPVDPRFLGDPFDWLAFQQIQAGVPDIFRVFLSTAQQLVIFQVGTSRVSGVRRQVASYNIHFIPTSLANPSTLNSLQGQNAAFAISDIVLSIGAPQPGGLATGSVANLYGRAGYYFAAPVNQAGIESRFFAGPVRAPIQGNFVTAVTPPDVTNPQVSISTETVNERSVRKLTFSATVPSNGTQGVIAILGGGTGGTPGDRIAVQFTSASGSGASATAIVNASGNVNSPHPDGVGTDIILATTGSGYLTPPTIAIPGITGTFEAVLGTTTDYFGYQIYMDGYFGDITVRETAATVTSNASFPSTTSTGFMYLLPDLTASSTNFYFVSITSTGSRRPDPTSSPSVNIPGGVV